MRTASMQVLGNVPARIRSSDAILSLSDVIRHIDPVLLSVASGLGAWEYKIMSAPDVLSSSFKLLTSTLLGTG
jgi:uncharacterized MnhB-related membrane protein